MTILSMWVKNPITFYSKDTSLVGVRCDEESDLLTIVRLRQYDGGFVVKSVESKVVCETVTEKFVEYEIDCSTEYAEQHKESNQALWHVTVLVAEDKK